MKKTDKKLDNKLRKTLTEVCSIALEEYEGFMWLTHFVNYNDFPGSLCVVSVFDKNEQLLKMRKNNNEENLYALIKERLISININIKDISSHVRFEIKEHVKRKSNK